MSDVWTKADDDAWAWYLGLPRVDGRALPTRIEPAVSQLDQMDHDELMPEDRVSLREALRMITAGVLTLVVPWYVIAGIAWCIR